MADLAKVAIITVGGYFVLKYVFGVDLLSSFETATTVPATQATGSSTVGTSTSPQAANPTNASAQNTETLVAQAIDQAYGSSAKGSGAYHNTDEWNYYYNIVRGIPGPAPETLFPGVDRNKLYSIGEWWSAMTGQGFSGLGLIAHYINPYWNPQGTQFGDNLTATGIEMYRKSF